mmetsp:Transcript_60692/g.112607  ORF Transcript_60692/g.112607 Transcript_60692/m.112607 type:complete len:116 (+) Transcript_60692:54-401(+)
MLRLQASSLLPARLAQVFCQGSCLQLRTPKYKPRRRRFRQPLPPFKGFPGITTPVVTQLMPDEIPAWRHAELKEEHLRAMLPPPPGLRDDPRPPRPKGWTYIPPEKDKRPRRHKH